MISDTELLAFLNGALAEPRMSEIEAALAVDEALVARLEALANNSAAVDQSVAAAFDAVLAEPLPPALLAAASPAVVDLAAARAAREANAAPRSPIRWWQPAALAASLAIGLVIGAGVPRGNSDALIIADAAGTRAGPTLAAALASTRSGTDARLPGGVLRPVISVRAGNGELCRQFGVQQDQAALSALACRRGDQWQIVVASSSAGSRSDYAQAAGPGEAAITAALDALAAGDPMDAEAEAKALARP
ncbi:hypothetical protein [Sandarakinorhabdus sp. AAP62]|uniref:hypothetical protein n=1 Tax=Sandarakinorhabdus sp. AAP62 TaxID=1248916 RepID=UPI000305EE2A|nr:hypothetical protein [Sandarakinorhabdus sp. AAP62]